MSKTTEDDLRETLDSAAEEIAGMSPNPRAWLSWVAYLLERLETQALKNPAYSESFGELLTSLQDQLRNRMRTGGW